MKVLAVTQSHKMDITDYQDTQVQNVRVFLLGSDFHGHTTNNDLLKDGTFEDVTSVLNKKNLKLLIDCVNLNWKLFGCFISKRESKEHSGLINIRNCSHPILNHAFKTGANTTG